MATIGPQAWPSSTSSSNLPAEQARKTRHPRWLYRPCQLQVLQVFQVPHTYLRFQAYLLRLI